MIKYNGSQNTATEITDKLEGIGKRIKLIRKRRKMTQSELAGKEITRNMLSRIENGYALPSLPTLIHISDKLGVPVSALLDDCFLDDHNRSKAIRNAREYMKQGRYDAALKIITNPDIISDDETALIITECKLALSRENIGMRKYFDAYENLKAAENKSHDTIYSSAGSAYIASLYKALAKAMLPVSDNNISCSPPEFDNYIDLYIYLRLIDLFDKGNIVKAVNLASLCEISDRLLSAHIAAKLDMANGRYREAEAKLKQITESEKNSPTALGGLMLYRIYWELEQCAKGENDYVLAYTYREEKLKLYSLMSGIKL
ncbi:MAG: helix-turn-helix domain-containing protein [Ruminococcaceae bacterium]|nr:helix-turn-helix domain-containing protein [Oscillospiraceae bacterium]